MSNECCCSFRKEEFSPYSHEIAPYRNPYSTDRATGNDNPAVNANMIELQEEERRSERMSHYSTPNPNPEHNYDVPRNRGSLMAAEHGGFAGSNFSPDETRSGFSNPAYDAQQPIYSRPQKLSSKLSRHEGSAFQQSDDVADYAELPELPFRTSNNYDADTTTFNY